MCTGVLSVSNALWRVPLSGAVGCSCAPYDAVGESMHSHQSLLSVLRFKLCDAAGVDDVILRGAALCISGVLGGVAGFILWGGRGGVLNYYGHCWDAGVCIGRLLLGGVVGLW